MSLKSLIKCVIPRRLIAWSGPRRHGNVALTFDDGPDPEVTPHILDILRKHNVNATFFVLGEKVRQHPQITERCRDEGHQVALHGQHHESIAHRTSAEIAQELRRGIETVGQLLSVPWCYRPVRGILSSGLVLQAARRKLQIIMWNRDPRDYLKTTADDVLIDLSIILPGDIVLLHDRCEPSAAALEQILYRIQELKMRPVTINSLLCPNVQPRE